jgi:hypothetical protein
MTADRLYEKWRAARSRSKPSEGFADRVMQQVESLPLPIGPMSGSNRAQRLTRVALCAGAVLAAAFRLFELLSAFSATGIEN